MAGAKIDTAALIAALDGQRRSRGMSWRQVASEAEVTPSLLSRIRGGMSPNARNFISLMLWLDLPARKFIAGSSETAEQGPDLLAQISLLLRTDAALDEADVQFLENIVVSTVTRARKREQDRADIRE